MISPEKDRERALQIGSLPLFKALYADPQLLKLYPYWAQFAKQSAVAKPLPLVDWYDELVNTTIADLQEMFVGIKTPQAAADHIAAFLNGKLVDGKPLTK
jgi:multiple sugar transport system substrate-binding protein